jgi:hypothetical protein
VTNAYYDDERGKIPYAYSYVVSINAADEASLVTERTYDFQKLPLAKTGAPDGRFKKRKRKSHDGFVRVCWDYPKDIYYHYRDYCRRYPDQPYKDAETFALNLFRGLGAVHAESSKEFQVRATRDGVTVGFSVALGRTPYFFKDRQTEITTDGKRRRIFHHVEEHQRVYPSGKVATVREHYRGERHFNWKGEAISVAPPENAEVIGTGVLKAIELEMGPVSSDFVDSKGVAELMTKTFEYDSRESRSHGHRRRG